MGGVPGGKVMTWSWNAEGAILRVAGIPIEIDPRFFVKNSMQGNRLVDPKVQGCLAQSIHLPHILKSLPHRPTLP